MTRSLMTRQSSNNWTVKPLHRREQLVESLPSAFQLVERERPMNPAIGVFGSELDDRLGQFETSLPVPGVGIDLQAYREHFRMGSQPGLDFLQFFIGFVGVAEFQPALGGVEMVDVGRVEGFHL